MLIITYFVFDITTSYHATRVYFIATLSIAIQDRSSKMARVLLDFLLVPITQYVSNIARLGSSDVL